MDAQLFARKLARLRRVAVHIDRHLDTPLCLEELAEIAHLSRFHFERVFGNYAGETPLARVRRLRLMKARIALEHGRARSLLSLALDSGYTSAEAFSRAFRCQHGLSPSEVRFTPVRTPPIRIEHLETQAVQFLRHEGGPAADLAEFDELRAYALLADIPRERRKGWCIQWEGTLADNACSNDVLDAALLSDRLGQRIGALHQGCLPGGHYAVLRQRGSYATPPRSELAQTIQAATGRQLAEGPVLRCFQNTSYLPADFERQCDIYIPVTP